MGIVRITIEGYLEEILSMNEVSKIKRKQRTNLYKEMLHSYKNEFGEMKFRARKINDDCIVTYANRKLLEVMNLDEDDVVGSSISDNKLSSEEMKKAYDMAFKGNEVFFYFFPQSAPEVFLFVFCEPFIEDGYVTEVIGHCASLKNQEEGMIGELLNHYKPFKIIN
ncbi:MAG: hypothetical protein ACQET8_19045 [Bacillota bacterium]